MYNKIWNFTIINLTTIDNLDIEPSEERKETSGDMEIKIETGDIKLDTEVVPMGPPGANLEAAKIGTEVRKASHIEMDPQAETTTKKENIIIGESKVDLLVSKKSQEMTDTEKVGEELHHIKLGTVIDTVRTGAEAKGP